MPWTVTEARAKNKSIATASQARQWTAIANSTLAACQKNGGTDCEGRAIRIANGVLKKRRMEMGESSLAFDAKSEMRVGYYLGEPELPLQHVEHSEASSDGQSKAEFDVWDKLVIREGIWVHPVQGFKLDVTPDRIQRWIANHKKITAHAPVFLPRRHSRDPIHNTGRVQSLSMRQGEDGKKELWARLNVTDSEVNRKLHEGSMGSVSVCVDPDIKIPDPKGSGEIIDIGEGIEHIAWTMMPAAYQNSEPIHVGYDLNQRETQYWSLVREGTLEFQIGKEPPKEVVYGNARIAKDKSHYRLGTGRQNCGNCISFRYGGVPEGQPGDGTCTIVDGSILRDRLSDYFRPRVEMEADDETEKHEDETAKIEETAPEEQQPPTEETNSQEGQEGVVSPSDDPPTEEFPVVPPEGTAMETHTDGNDKKKKKKGAAAAIPYQMQQKLDPAAAVRNRPGAILPHTHPKVNDGKDHFPANDAAHARNALSRVNQFTSAPSWFSGSLAELRAIITRAVKRKFPKIEVSEKSILSTDLQGEADMALDLAKLAEQIGFEDTLSDDTAQVAEQLKAHFSASSETPPVVDPKNTDEYRALEKKLKEQEGKVANYETRLHSLEADMERRRMESVADRKRRQYERMQDAIKTGRIKPAQAQKLTGSYKFEFSADAPLDEQEAALSAFESKLEVVETYEPHSAWAGIDREITKRHLIEESGDDDEEAEKAEAEVAAKSQKKEADREAKIKSLFERTGFGANYAGNAVTESTRTG